MRKLILTTALLAVFFSSLGFANEAQTATCSSSSANAIGAAQSNASSIASAIHCQDLNVGESLVVDTLHARESSPTSVPQGYSVEKLDSKKFKVRINLNFIADPSLSTTPEKMMSKARECMRAMSPFFRSKNGQSIDVELLNNDEASRLPTQSKPPMVPVKIVKAGTRGENINYPEDIDCKTIGHELLHLMGLVDEYSTTGDDGSGYQGNYFDANGKVVKNYNPTTGMANGVLITPKPRWVYAYNCRVVSKRPSMMNVAAVILDDVVPQTFQCSCVSDECKRIMSISSKKIQSLYLSSQVSLIPDQDFRMNYCHSTSLPPLDIQKFEQQGEIFKLNSSTANSIDYEYSSFSDPNYSQVKRTKVSCSCDESSDCLKTLGKMKQIAESKTVLQKLRCPDGSTQVSNSYGAVDVNDPYAVKKDGSGGFSFNTITAGFYAKASLLQPNHFERIIGGQCSEKAKGYNICGRFFLETDPLDKCNQVPAECKDMNYFLGSQ